MNNIIKLIIFIIFALLTLLFTEDYSFDTKYVTPSKMHEKDYVNKHCTGEIEHVLPDKTRIDCLTDEYAIEYDYAKKWAESIGQSLYYAKKTGKKPAVAIIISKPSDRKYIQRIEAIEQGITIFEILADNYSE